MLTRAQEFAQRRTAVPDTVARAEEEGDGLEASVDVGPPSSMRRTESGRGNRGRGSGAGRGRRLCSSARSARPHLNRVSMSPSMLAAQAASPATVVAGNRRPASASALGGAHSVTLPEPRQLAPGKLVDISTWITPLNILIFVSLPVFAPPASLRDETAMDCSPAHSVAGPPPEIVLETGGPSVHAPHQQALAVITQTQDDSNDSARSNLDGTDVNGNEVSGDATCTVASGVDHYYF